MVFALIIVGVWIAGVISGFESPPVLIGLVVGIAAPFILKYFPKSWKGPFMAAIVFGLSIVVAVAILLVTGGTQGWTLENVSIEVATIYATTQLVFSAFKSALNLPDPGPPPLKTIGVG